MKMLKITQDIKVENRATFLEKEEFILVPLNKINYISSSEDISRIDTDDFSIRINVGANQIQDFIKTNTLEFLN